MIHSFSKFSWSYKMKNKAGETPSGIFKKHFNYNGL